MPFGDRRGPSVAGIGFGVIATCTVLLLILGYVVYTQFRIDVPSMHIAVLTKKTGDDLQNNQEVAKDETQKGLQLEVLTEGRYFYNFYTWDWEVYPMIEIPENKMGVRVRLYGDDLPYGHFVATAETEKGIVKDVLKPGRYAINAVFSQPAAQGQARQVDMNGRSKSDFVEVVELHDPVIVPAGFRGVVTNLAGPMPEDPNQLLVEDGKRGVQLKTLDEGTYYMNPYMYRIELIDCRSQRFNLAENEDMGFPSKDGFWVNLDGIIEFHVMPDPEQDEDGKFIHQGAAGTFVTYNEDGKSGIDQEIIRKVIMPNARAFCRLRGSNSSGRDFIGGETRQNFQNEFQKAIRETCAKQGIEIVQALITRIMPPQAIAGPVRDREIAQQQEAQYQQETAQQVEEAKLATQNALITQKERLVEAEREVIKVKTMALQEQEVALEQANRDKEVAVEELVAAKDQAIATMSEKTAEAAVVDYENEALAAGWKRSVHALGGDGQSLATYELYRKIAPAYHTIMANTADSPLMQVFEGFESSDTKVSEMPPLERKVPTLQSAAEVEELLKKHPPKEREKVEDIKPVTIEAQPATTDSPAQPEVGDPKPKAKPE
jgi:regulator of protease activity HflC (stomatin/prohibitin superfamily)